MIPKIIHYCWFGKGEKPKRAQKCIASWKKYCSDYQIVEWNEDTFDVNLNGYTKMCYEQKKWAFLSDYVRLLVVYQHGGLYFDTDVELLRNPDFLLINDAFFGFETDEVCRSLDNSEKLCRCSVASGLGFGSIAYGKAVNSLIKEYDYLLDGCHGVKMCPELNSVALEKIGLKRNGEFQTFDWGTVYTKEFFNPYESDTGRLNKTNNTVSVHWYMGSCLTKRQRIRAAITKPFHRVFGVNCFKWLK